MNGVEEYASNMFCPFRTESKYCNADCTASRAYVDRSDGYAVRMYRCALMDDMDAIGRAAERIDKLGEVAERIANHYLDKVELEKRWAHGESSNRSQGEVRMPSASE